MLLVECEVSKDCYDSSIKEVVNVEDDDRADESSLDAGGGSWYTEDACKVVLEMVPDVPKGDTVTWKVSNCLAADWNGTRKTVGQEFPMVGNDVQYVG